MTAEEFRAVLRQQPFQPFTIRTADGRSLEVVHSDFVAQSPSGRTVIVVDNDDTYCVLDVPQISEIEVHSGLHP